ncbi:MAG: alkaline phosphatase family protein [Cytophagia bacterium]|nr:alkaline phosphatase family protein [Cytophagia bacterium]
MKTETAHSIEQTFLKDIILSVVLISTLTRVLLLILSYQEISFHPANLLYLFGYGLFYDLANTSLFILPFIFLIWLTPFRFIGKKVYYILLVVLYSIAIFTLIFNAIGEVLFWDEFSTRFNFIAVDYLIYTTEVIGNIRQSYPMGWIMLILFSLSSIISYLSFRKIKIQNYEHLKFKRRTQVSFIFFTIAVLNLLLINNTFHQRNENQFVNELAGNGMYELFSAYRNNELNYEQFYPSLPIQQALQLVYKQKALTTNTRNENFEFKITADHSEQKRNVILISVESLSAEFLAYEGIRKGVTPFLDSLTNHCYLFTNVYATGTRTVRGLEALSLSIPPTPGQSIVRRPNNENLFTLSSVFNNKGYESLYIYGGYGYFDNMNYFFSHNGYQVIDRTSLEDEEIDYENIWGVADENLFDLALREIDTRITQHKSVFAHVMTTSNHRPYTYPDGRIDIPSHTSRLGAVKYTDYSIGKFIREASQKSWFNNTVFVITADHCASSAGKEELPIEKYRIPLLIYAPAFIKPAVEKRMMSQIDIVPTVLGLLNFSYKSKFMGFDLLHLKHGSERAFISTYQRLGYMKQDSLLVLTPQHAAMIYRTAGNKIIGKGFSDKDKQYAITREGISWYESAGYLFKNNKLKL